MKNNTNSIINKISEVNSELVNINRKLESHETIHKKFETSIKDEIAFRQNVEKKTFQINETFLNKFTNITSQLEDLDIKTNKKIESLQIKFIDEIQKNNERNNKENESILKRLNENEEKILKLSKELEFYKSDYNEKVNKAEDSFTNDIIELKKEISEKKFRIEIIEKKINDNQFTLQNEMAFLSKESTITKNDIEMIKNFKENTILNFKDISEEFLKNEANHNKLLNNLKIQLNEFESK